MADSASESDTGSLDGGGFQPPSPVSRYTSVTIFISVSDPTFFLSPYRDKLKNILVRLKNFMVYTSPSVGRNKLVILNKWTFPV